ncbi:predicted protein [Uncinocarpus reesii 1704]|uniref:Ubiquitin 3 binding protein But2 C-terminal domain-containing protein n=1 Tax=Uncinocarpus reesii (strain UAMH 1704) TaxID=336963 RepID=C4JRD9_UNCRE|nr:uncharacterized protein UREG_05028 [Uncinocarpus reesii 1704]EEP80186.1 predicted protein [Uncinocarpus reesii 1704]
MFPVKTAARIAFASIFAWIVLALVYAGLPSPPPRDNGTDYPTKVLRSGKTLTRIYKTDIYFPFGESGHEAIDKAHITKESNFALSFTLTPTSSITKSEALSITISDKSPIPLNPPGNSHQNGGHKTKDGPPATSPETLSKPFTVRSPAGDKDGINLPWFEEADAVLLGASVSSGRMYITLRTRWNENGQFEIHTDGPGWVCIPIPS